MKSDRKTAETTSSLATTSLSNITCVFFKKRVSSFFSLHHEERPKDQKTKERTKGTFDPPICQDSKHTFCQDLQGLTFRNFSTHSRRICQQIESKQHNILKRKMGVGENKQSHKNHNFFLQFCRRSQLGSFIADFLPSPPSTNSSRLKYSVLWDQERKKADY